MTDTSMMFGRMSPAPPDINTLRTENRMLKNKIRQLHNDLQAEQGEKASVILSYTV